MNIFYGTRARYYNPGSGRFLSEDPIGFESGDVNEYRYVINNPIKYKDSTGEGPLLAGLVFTICESALAIYGGIQVVNRVESLTADLAEEYKLLQDLQNDLDNSAYTCNTQEELDNLRWRYNQTKKVIENIENELKSITTSNAFTELLNQAVCAGSAGISVFIPVL